MPRKRRVVRVGAATGLLLAVVVVLAVAPGGEASRAAGVGVDAIGCKFAGKRYVGTTSQKKRLCFTLTADGKRLREYAYEYRAKCKQSGGIVRLSTSNASIRSIFQKPPALKQDGTFSSTGTSGFFKGKVGTGSATGTFRNQSTQMVPGSVTPPITYVTAACDTGLVRWTARKASR